MRRSVCVEGMRRSVHVGNEKAHVCDEKVCVWDEKECVCGGGGMRSSVWRV